MRRTTDDTGFAPPPTRPLGRERRSVDIAALLASVGLAAGTLVAASVITAGIARADTLMPVAGQHTSVIAVALVLGLLLAGMGGLTVMSLAARPPSRRPLRD